VHRFVVRGRIRGAAVPGSGHYATFVRKNSSRNGPGPINFRLARNSAILAAGVLFILWPSSILKLTIVQGFTFIVFNSATRARLSAGTEAPLEVWRMRLHQIPADMLALSVCVALAAICYGGRRAARNWRRFFLYGLLLLLVVFRNTAEGARYIASLFAPL